MACALDCNLFIQGMVTGLAVADLRGLRFPLKPALKIIMHVAEYN